MGTNDNEKPAYQTISADQFHAQGVLNVIGDFVTQFETDHPPEDLAHILTKTGDTEGGGLSSDQEAYTVEHLIHPLLDQLGYEDITTIPDDLGGEAGGALPDFHLPVDRPECLCVLEAKPFGHLAETKGDNPSITSEMESYLTPRPDMPFPHGHHGTDIKYLLGIATDGLVWHLYGTDLHSEVQFAVHSESLRETFRKTARHQHDDERLEDRWLIHQRDWLREQFIPAFTEHGIAAAFEHSTPD